MSWWRRGPRVRGEPTSSNGASSLHLAWELPAGGPWREVAVTLEVVEPPTVARLYFWALQASFVDGGRHLGAAHLGLQAHPRHPGGTAVNWGGYRAGGGELDGSPSALPSALGNPNTRDLTWRPATPYRLAIVAGGPGRWRGQVTDLSTGTTTVVRDLLVPATALAAPTMWSEVFARCDHPSSTVRWSDPVAVDADGTAVAPTGARVNYQSPADGGCANTTAVADDGGGLRQVTATERLVPLGTVLPLRRRRS